MQPIIIRSKDIKENDFGPIKVKNLMNTEQYESFSVAQVKVVGEQKIGLDPNSDLAYFVLEGSGKFYIEDEVFSVEKGDLVFIPKNTRYKDEGPLTLLAVASPRFNREERKRN